MAVKKSLQLPETFSADCSREDWIQLAVITMFQCCEEYDRKRPFDNYVRFMVSRKLADKQRSILRKNPPADSEVLYLFNEMKKVQGDKQAIANLARDTNRSLEQLQEIVDVGVGPRIFTSEVDEASQAATPSRAPTPEAQVAGKQIRKILLKCINNLSEKSKNLFLQHEMEDSSFKILFTQVCCNRSLASFKRWYKAEIFERVQLCVTSQS